MTNGSLITVKLVKNPTPKEYDTYTNQMENTLRVQGKGLDKVYKNGTPDKITISKLCKLADTTDIDSPAKKEEYVKELRADMNASVYSHIVLSLEDTNLVEKIQGKHQDKGYEAKKYLDSLYKVQDNDTRLRVVEAEREEFIKAGITKVTATSLTQFITRLTNYNNKLTGSHYSWAGPLMCTKILDTVARTEGNVVKVFKAANRKKKVLMDPDKLEMELVAEFEDHDRVEALNAQQDQVQALLTKVKQLEIEKQSLEKVVAMRADTRAATTDKCNKCGKAHKGECYGELVAKGIKTKEQIVKESGRPADMMERIVDSSVKAYNDRNKGGDNKRVLQCRATVVQARSAAADVDPKAAAVLADVCAGRDILAGVDTKAEMHMLPSIHFFPNGVRETSLVIQCAGYNTVKPVGIGDAHLIVDGHTIVLTDALCAPQCAPLISVPALWVRGRVEIRGGDEQALVWTQGPNKGFKLHFDENYNLHVRPLPNVEMSQHCAAYEAAVEDMAWDTGIPSVVVRGTSGGGAQAKLTQREAVQLWGARLPVGPERLRALPSVVDGVPTGLKNTTAEMLHEDGAKDLANAPRIHPRDRTNATDVERVGQLTQSDLCGPYKPAEGPGEMAGARYKAMFVDAHSNAHRVAFMDTKDRYPHRLEKYFRYHEGRHGATFKGGTLYCDNEAVLNSGAVKGVCVQYGVTLRNSCEYEPWQNSRPERAIGEDNAVVREMLIRGGNGKDVEEYWAPCAQQAALVHNYTTHRGDDNITPYEAETGRRPDVSRLRVMLCLAYARLPRAKRDGKLQQQAVRCIHLGCSWDKPGYILQVIEPGHALEGKFIATTQVVFRENVFPLRDGRLQSEAVADPCGVTIDIAPEADDDEDWPEPEPEQYDGATTADGAGDDAEAVVPTRSYPRRATMNPYAPGRQDAEILPYSALAYHTAVDGVIADVPEGWTPRNMKQVLRMPEGTEKQEWLQAHADEVTNHFKNVLRWERRPADLQDSEMQTLLDLWYKKPNGRKKCRIVLNWNKNKGTDMHGRTHSPTGSFTTVRSIASLAARSGMVLGSADVSNAYGHAPTSDTDKTVYCRNVPGVPTPKCPDTGEYMVCRVNNLNGHPTGGRNWYKHLRGLIMSFPGVTVMHSFADQCLFRITEEDGETMLVVVYVDDILDMSKEGSTMRKRFYVYLNAHVPIKDFGQIEEVDFLGTTIHQSQGSVTITSPRHISELAAKYGMPGGVHMAYTVPVAEDLPTLVEDAKEGRETVDNTLEKTFAGLVCTMLYIGSTTRPDIMYGVGMLTRCLTCPTKPLMRAAERIMYYLENTKHLGLRYTADTAQQAQHGSYACTKVTGMSDANHAVKRSTSGRCFDAGAKAVVSYGMKKQASVAISTAEAEINAASEAASEAVHLAGIHADAGFPLNGPVVLTWTTRRRSIWPTIPLTSPRPNTLSVAASSCANWSKTSRLKFNTSALRITRRTSSPSRSRNGAFSNTALGC